jgi:hypothetical protein
MRTNWIGLRMSPPLLLPVAPMDDLQLGKEEADWTNIVKDKGYHDQQYVTKYIAWDMRE